MVLPFKSSLLQAAVAARCPIAAAGIDYQLSDGSVADEVCYWRDMTLAPHLLNLFGKKSIESTVAFLRRDRARAIAKARPRAARGGRGPPLMKTNGATQTQTIRVIYPGEEGRIALRTDHDWERDLEPRFVSREDCCRRSLQVETAQPYFYFKPVLLRNGTIDWSRGENYLAVATSGRRSKFTPSSSTTDIAASAN